MSDAVLFVDDEVNVVEGFKRQLRKEFTLDTAVGPEEGLKALADVGPLPWSCPTVRCRVWTGWNF